MKVMMLVFSIVVLTESALSSESKWRCEEKIEIIGNEPEAVASILKSAEYKMHFKSYMENMIANLTAGVEYKLLEIEIFKVTCRWHGRTICEHDDPRLIKKLYRSEVQGIENGEEFEEHTVIGHVEKDPCETSKSPT